MHLPQWTCQKIASDEDKVHETVIRQLRDGVHTPVAEESLGCWLSAFGPCVHEDPAKLCWSLELIVSHKGGSDPLCYCRLVCTVPAQRIWVHVYLQARHLFESAPKCEVQDSYIPRKSAKTMRS